jgi:hypothetical protein
MDSFVDLGRRKIELEDDDDDEDDGGEERMNG